MNLPCLVFADLHAQKSNLKELEHFFYKSLPSIVEETGCRTTVIVGDIFNSASKIDTEVYTSMYIFLENFRVFTPDIRIVAGNHDIYSYSELITPLLPFQDICKIYTEYEKEDGFEFVPYSNDHNKILNYKYLDTPGVTFIHYGLAKIVEELHLQYDMPRISNEFSKRLYVAGHIHVPMLIDNELSLGCPVQYMFDVEKEFATNVYIINKKQELLQKHINITRFNVFEVYDSKDLAKLNIEYGEVSTYVKLKLMTDNIKPSDILEFKKKHNVLVVLARQRESSTTKKLDSSKSSSPLEIYRDFIKMEDTKLDKKELYKIVLEELKDDKKREN